MGALAALHARERSGRGQVVDAALYESVLQVMESLVPEFDAMGIVRGRHGGILPGIAPSNVYACSDGEYLIGANGDAIFARLAQAMGRPELANDPRYATHVARGEHQAELDGIIEAWTRTNTVAEVEALMIEYSVPAGKVYRAPDMLQDPHFAAREAIVPINHPFHGTIRMQNAFPKLSETPSRIRRIAPQTPGEHNAEIYGARLQLDAGQLTALEARGVI